MTLGKSLHEIAADVRAEDIEDARRNRRIRAAAPDLLAALEALHHEFEKRAICVNRDEHDSLAVAYRTARAAIAKARG